MARQGNIQYDAHHETWVCWAENHAACLGEAWPCSAVDLVRWYHEGLSVEKLATKVGKSDERVRRVLIAHGVAMRDAGRPFAAVDEDALVADYKAGMGIVALTKKYHTSWGRIRALLVERSVPLRPVGRPRKTP